MPTSNKKADKLIARGRAVRCFDHGLFYIKMLDRADGYTQPIAEEMDDPGSEKAADPLKGEAHTDLNIQADAVNRAKDAE
jgi:hypothetical protein